jgi:hypothetical protein
MQTHSPRAFPLGVAAPVGTPHVKARCECKARARRPRLRTCLRKCCNRQYVPRRWNQRYCHDPECQREVRRWQAARRQARHREDAAARRRHAQAERERRQRAKAAPKAVESVDLAPARGHAARAAEENFFPRHSATGRAAMKPPSYHPVTRRATVAPPAGRPFTTCWIASASGSLAVRWRAARNGPSSIRPHASGDRGGDAALLRDGARMQLGSDTPCRRAGRQLSRDSGRSI